MGMVIRTRSALSSRLEFSPKSDVQLQWELYPGQKDLTFTPSTFMA